MIGDLLRAFCEAVLAREIIVHQHLPPGSTVDRIWVSFGDLHFDWSAPP